MSEKSEFTSSDIKEDRQKPASGVSRRQVIKIGAAGAAMAGLTSVGLAQTAYAAPKSDQFSTTKRNLRDVYVGCNPEFTGDIDCQQCLTEIGTSMKGPAFFAFLITAAANYGLPSPTGGHAFPDGAVTTCITDCQTAGSVCYDGPNSPHKKRDIVIDYLKCIYSQLESAVEYAILTAIAYRWLEYLKSLPTNP